jgi:hypothetical protein
MPRRTYHRSRPGELYASEWPEWHVDCAAEGCTANMVAAGLGECMTLREARKSLVSAAPLEGWTIRRGLAYCPLHAAE